MPDSTTPPTDPRLAAALVACRAMRTELDRLDVLIAQMEPARARRPLAAWADALRDSVDGLEADIEARAAGR